MLKSVPIPDSMARVTRSPSDEAIGVATLSGLMLNFLETIIMNMTMLPKTKLANEAVETLVPIITKIADTY